MTAISTYTDKDGHKCTYDAAMDNATALFQVSVHRGAIGGRGGGEGRALICPPLP